MPQAIKIERGITIGKARSADGAWKVSDEATGEINKNKTIKILDRRLYIVDLRI